MNPKIEKTGDTTKLQIIGALQRLRDRSKLTRSADELRGYRAAATQLCDLVEMTTNPSDLWTSLPKEAQLSARSRIGDHLYVTRAALGVLP